MELEKFVKEALIAIQNGCEAAKTEKTHAGTPISYQEGAQGVEFDIGIEFDYDSTTSEPIEDKILVNLADGKEFHSRLRFFVPIKSKS